MQVEAGMNIYTRTKRVRDNVRQNLQFLRCRHPNACMTCDANGQ